MEIIIYVVAMIVCVACLTLGSYITAFYHAFESNKPKMDKYALAAIIVLFTVFYILMRWVVAKW